MNTITHWIQSELATALGWALLHSLWQGAAIALILAAGLLLARRQSPKVRYGMSFFAMAALLLACIATFAWVYEPAPEAAAPSSTQEATLLFNEAQEALPAGPGPVLAEAATDHPAVYFDYFEQHLPLLVTGWLLGVLLLSLRMLGEIAYIRHLRSYRCRPAEAAWLERLSRMKEQMGIRRQVELLETRRIHSPMVVGVFKQVILLPAGLLSGLSTEQVEAVLAHELAHVRRNDYLANLLLSLVEILLFFNPMMWWISRKIRAEREHACDDLALEMTGDTLALVRSLALLEEWRLSGRPLAMAFTGREGGVLSRIHRLLQRDDKRQVAAKAFWSLSIFCACLALLAFQAGDGQVKPKPSEMPAGEPSSIEQAETDQEAEAEIAAEEEFPAAVLAEAPAGMEPTLALSDTIPPDVGEIEKEMQLLSEKMRASEMEMRKKEQALRSKELQLRKEAQQGMQAKQKALMELEMQMRDKEHEREMLENESEMAGQELELARMELEEKQHALNLQEEQLEQAHGQELQQKLKAFQESQRQLMEKERALELRAFEMEKKQRQQSFEKDKAIQELESRRFQLEQEVQVQEQDLEFKMMQLRHEMQQMEADRRIKEQEIEARQRELEMKLEKLMEREDE